MFINNYYYNNNNYNNCCDYYTLVDRTLLPQNF